MRSAAATIRGAQLFEGKYYFYEPVSRIGGILRLLCSLTYAILLVQMYTRYLYCPSIRSVRLAL
jgi:hypothetical protein